MAFFFSSHRVRINLRRHSAWEVATNTKFQALPGAILKQNSFFDDLQKLRQEACEDVLAGGKTNSAASDHVPAIFKMNKQAKLALSSDVVPETVNVWCQHVFLPKDAGLRTEIIHQNQQHIASTCRSWFNSWRGRGGTQDSGSAVSGLKRYSTAVYEAV